jgi:hypothetical protein
MGIPAHRNVAEEGSRTRMSNLHVVNYFRNFSIASRPLVRDSIDAAKLRRT